MKQSLRSTKNLLSSSMAQYDISDLTFLIVEDNKFTRSLLKDVLRGMGILSFWEATDGEQALEILNKTNPDIIICDWSMSPMDGVEYVRRLRKLEDNPNAYLPVIMLTGYTEMHRVAVARDAGVTEYISKPIKAKPLYARICKIIEHPRDFIMAPTYLGPDRRRHVALDYSGPLLRKCDLEPKGEKLSEVGKEARKPQKGTASLP